MQSDKPASENSTPPEESLGPEAPSDAATVSDDSSTLRKKPASPVGKTGSVDGSKRLAETRSSERTQVDATRTGRVPYRQRDLSLVDQGLLFLADVAAVWRRGLRWVRSQLPAPWQAKLPDEILSAILLGLLFLLLALWHPLGGSKPAAVTLAPESETIETPAPEAAEAGPEVSPEQTLIAEIQEQVAEVTQSYAAGLIQSVQANFQQGSLQVDLGSQWYDLSADQQNQLAQDLYERAQELSFNKLFLFDDSTATVARSPVVGTRMVILQRSLSAT